MTENEAKKQKPLGVVHKMKVLFSLDADPNEREARIMDVVLKAVNEPHTDIAYSRLNDIAYVTNEQEKFIIKIARETFTLVQEEAGRVLLNIHLSAVIASKLFAIVDNKVDERIDAIEARISHESDRVIEDLNNRLGKEDVGQQTKHNS